MSICLMSRLTDNSTTQDLLVWQQTCTPWLMCAPVVVQGKNAELEQIVRQKELEIERLQQQLESKKSSGSSDSSVDVCAAVELDEDPTTAYAHEVRACQHLAHLDIPISALHAA